MATTKDSVMLSSGHMYQELEEEVMTQYTKDFPGSTDKVLKLSPGGWIVPKPYLKFEKKIYNFQYRPDDVVVMTYPKCGTTWAQELVWTMRYNPNLDRKEQASEALFIRSPFIDMDMLMPESMGGLEILSKEPVFQGFEKWCPGKDPKDGVMLQVAEAHPSPRTLKTHLPFTLYKPSLLDTCKVVFVVRNPKDAVLSYQHHCKLLMSHGFIGDQDCFVKYFVDDLLIWGSFAEYVKEGWARRHHSNLHLIHYEDLKADIAGEIKKLDSFLGTKLTDQQLKNVRQQTTFKTMQESDPLKVMKSAFINKEVAEKDGPFIRKGVAGGWKNALTPHQEEMIDEYVEKHFKDVDIKFKYN